MSSGTRGLGPQGLELQTPPWPPLLPGRATVSPAGRALPAYPLAASGSPFLCTAAWNQGAWETLVRLAGLKPSHRPLPAAV